MVKQCFTTGSNTVNKYYILYLLEKNSIASYFFRTSRQIKFGVVNFNDYKFKFPTFYKK